MYHYVSFMYSIGKQMFIDPSFIILAVFILESITIMLYCYVDFFREIVVAVDTDTEKFCLL